MNFDLHRGHVYSETGQTYNRGEDDNISTTLYLIVVTWMECGIFDIFEFDCVVMWWCMIRKWKFSWRKYSPHNLSIKGRAKW